MNGKTIYCLAYRAETPRLLAMTPLDDGRWRVELLPDDAAGSHPWAGQDVVVAVPAEQVRTSLAQLPGLKGKQLAQVVRGWVAREEGGRPEEWVVGSHPLAEFTTPEGEKRRDMFLLYARRDDVARWLAPLAGADPDRVRIVAEDLALEQLYRSTRDDRDDPGTWNLVHVGRERTYLCVAGPDGPLLTRQLPGCREDDAEESEDQVRRLVTEIDRTAAYVRQLGRYARPGRIVLCGAPGMVEPLRAGLAGATGLEVEVWPLADLFTAAAGDLDPEWLPVTAAGALSPLHTGLDLAPRAEGGMFAALARHRAVRAVGWIAAALAPLLLAGGAWTWHAQRQQLSEVSSALAAAREQVVHAVETIRTVRLLDQKVQRMNELGRRTEDLSAILFQLAQDVPPQVVLHALELRDENDGLHLSLTGESVADRAEEAQRAFLALKRRLDGSVLLVPGSEPHQLEISGQDGSGTLRKRVVFRLEYRVRRRPVEGTVELADGGRGGLPTVTPASGPVPGGDR